MAEHRVRKNNIIYIIPDDELFRKWNDDEAFIDEYGRLMNRKPHRVLRELKHYVEDAPTIQQRTSVPPATPTERDPPLKIISRIPLGTRRWRPVISLSIGLLTNSFMRCFRMYGMNILYRSTIAQRRRLPQRN